MAKSYTERCPVCGEQGRFVSEDPDNFDLMCDEDTQHPKPVYWNSNEIVTNPEHLKSPYVESMGGHAV